MQSIQNVNQSMVIIKMQFSYHSHSFEKTTDKITVKRKQNRKLDNFRTIVSPNLLKQSK